MHCARFLKNREVALLLDAVNASSSQLPLILSQGKGTSSGLDSLQRSSWTCTSWRG